jgi:8-amino-7-oxononanoate synthase
LSVHGGIQLPFSSLVSDLAALDAQGLRRERKVLDTAQSVHVTVDGRDYTAFCSNDYLGLANHPAIIEAAREGAVRFGMGAGASHLVLGHSRAHHDLEQALAEFLQLPRALLFSTGYMANIGVVTALAGREDAVFADRLNHASLNDACLLSRAKFKRYAHTDLDMLARLLGQTSARRKLVVTDVVFSMDGDIAPVRELLALCETHDAWLMLDDAHGFGVLGANGRGALEHFGISGMHSRRIIYMATLGKAAGGFGAFVAGDTSLIETLIQRARSYIYTTATPPLVAYALLKSLGVIASEGWRRDSLINRIIQLKQLLKTKQGKLLPSDTAIQPLIVGGNHAAMSLSTKLEAQGILVPAIRPPTVPQGSARLRISLSAAHTAEDIRLLVAALEGAQ